MPKTTFMKYLPPKPKLGPNWAQIGPKIKNAQNLLKFGLTDISNVPISILMSKIIFMKYLPPVRPKLASK